MVAREIYHDDIPVFLYGAFSEAGRTGSLNGENAVSGDEAKEKKAKAYITFPDNASTIEFRYAISFISAEQAKKNFENELKNTGFEDLKKAGEQVWAKTVGQIRIEGGTEAQKRSFYSSLYRTYERMVDISEDNQYYSGYDKKIHTSNRPFYVDDWTWDTYLAHHPLRVILNPSQEEDMLQSFVNMYEQSGWMPTFPVLFDDHACMNGFHSSVTLLDGYRKGLKNFDIAKGHEGMKKNAEQATMLPWRNGPKCELDDIYHSKGFFPALSQGEKDAPWKTQKRVRFLLDVWFKDNIFGIPGDEDGGGMTAFVVFSSMGFYPITPGLPVYTIGSPVFEKVTIDLPNGKEFKVLAKNCSVINKYIQSAKINDKALNVPTFTHEELVNGGTLELEMGPLPNKSWGTGK